MKLSTYFNWLTLHVFIHLNLSGQLITCEKLSIPVVLFIDSNLQLEQLNVKRTASSVENHLITKCRLLNCQHRLALFNNSHMRRNAGWDRKSAHMGPLVRVLWLCLRCLPRSSRTLSPQPPQIRFQKLFYDKPVSWFKQNVQS